MVTYKAKGVVADDDPWFAGVFTNGVLEQPVIDEADLIIGDLDRAVETAVTGPNPMLVDARIDAAEYSATLRAIRG